MGRHAHPKKRVTAWPTACGSSPTTELSHSEKKRAASPEKRPGGDEDPDLDCGICTELLTDARQAPCCGALACRECLNAAAVSNCKCPFCREELLFGEGLRDVRMERKAANTVRKCPHDSCEFTGKRDALRRHSRECDKRPVAAVVSDLREEAAAMKARLKDKNQELRDRAMELQRVVDKWETCALHQLIDGDNDVSDFEDYSDDDEVEFTRAPMFDIRGARIPWRDKEDHWMLSRAYTGLGGEIVVRKANSVITVTATADALANGTVLDVHVLASARLADRYSFQLEAPRMGEGATHVLPFTHDEFWERFVRQRSRRWFIGFGRGDFPTARAVSVSLSDSE